MASMMMESIADCVSSLYEVYEKCTQIDRHDISPLSRVRLIDRILYSGSLCERGIDVYHLITQLDAICINMFENYSGRPDVTTIYEESLQNVLVNFGILDQVPVVTDDEDDELTISLSSSDSEDEGIFISWNNIFSDFTEMESSLSLDQIRAIIQENLEELSDCFALYQQSCESSETERVKQILKEAEILLQTADSIRKISDQRLSEMRVGARIGKDVLLTLSRLCAVAKETAPTGEPVDEIVQQRWFRHVCDINNYFGDFVVRLHLPECREYEELLIREGVL